MSHDVVIVGGGPVGTGLAIELGQRGVSVAVVERYKQPQRVPKGQNLTQRTMEHFQAWGAEEALRAARIVPRDQPNSGLVSYGTILGDYSYEWLTRTAVRRFYNTENERLPQYETERVLRERVARLPSVEVFYGWGAEALTQDGEGVTVEIAEHEGPDRSELRGRWAVGCDGSKSFTRDAAGITQTRNDHDRVMVLLVFRSRELNRLLEKHPPMAFYNALTPELEGYWQFIGRVDAEETFFFHAPVPPGTTAENYDFAAYLHRTVGADFPVEFDYVGFWDLRFALADTYRKGRVLIAGDAAHSHPPYGGYGINLGFEDARNLGWKLAADAAGWAGPGLVDSYDAERRPVFASAARDFIERFIHEDAEFLRTHSPERDREAFEAAWARRSEGGTEVHAFEPHYEGSPVVFGPEGGESSARGEHSLVARAGHHLSPVTLSDGGSVFDRLGPGFTLLAFGADPAGFAEAAGRLGLPFETVADKESISSDYGAKLILVRPDQYVAWAGDAADDPEAILRRAAGG